MVEPFFDCPLDRVADQYGTPTHVLDLHVLRANARAFAQALRSNVDNSVPLYSVKTNYLPLVLRELKELGYGVDVVSGVELEHAQRIGFAPGQITFNGPYKTASELECAVHAGIFINIDSIDEARKISQISSSQSRTAQVGLRINPGISVYDSPDPTYRANSAKAAQQSKFGYSIGDRSAHEALKEIVAIPGLQVTGLHCHVGSQITSADALTRALDTFFEFGRAAADLVPIERMNVGGGFGVDGIQRARIGPLYQLMRLHGLECPETQPERLDLDILLKRVAQQRDKHNLDGVTVYAEPGRIIVSDASIILTRVGAVKHTGGLDWVIIDAGLNLLPTIAMAETHKVRSLRKSAAPLKQFRVGGPLCYEADVVTDSCLLPEDVHADDILIIQDSGAYSVSRSTNFIRPRAPVVAWNGNGTSLCWRRETYDDVFAFQHDA